MIQKSNPSQKLYAWRMSNRDKATAKIIHTRILEFVESVVKSGNKSDSRNIVTTIAVVAT